MKIKIIIVFIALYLIGCGNKKPDTKPTKECETMVVYDDENDHTSLISWGSPIEKIICGLSFDKNKYRAGDTIEGTCYVKNLSKSIVKIINRPVRLRDWTFVIEGPSGGNYDWKGPRATFIPPSEKDFIDLKPGEIMKFYVSPGGQIEQKVKPGGSDFNAVLPGQYRIRIVFYYSQSSVNTGIVELQISN